MPKISVIIPAYNVERYLSRCLNSVLSQTFKDFEIVVVNDGSSDRTGEICDEYASVDKRIRIVHKENEGVSIARNIGIENAQGEWCCFIDSDDWVESQYLENFDIDNNSDSQLIMQSFVIDNEIKKITTKVLLPDVVFKEPSSVVDFLERLPGVHNGFIWHRLFRLDIIKNRKLNFPQGFSFAEDGWFFLDYMQTVKKIVSSSKIGNHYIIRNGSLTSKHCAYSFSIYKELLEHYIESLNSFVIPQKRVEPHFQMIKRYACRLASSWCIENALTQEGEYDAFIGELKAIIVRYDIYNVRGLMMYQLLQKMSVKLTSRALQKKLFRLSLVIKSREETVRQKFLRKFQKLYLRMVLKQLKIGWQEK